MAEQYDAVIIGAGIIGASVGLELARLAHLECGSSAGRRPK